MEKDQIFILKDRGIVYINGEDARNLLKNIISNNIYKVSDNYSCFSSLLTPQGKYWFYFIIFKHQLTYLLDCELNLVEVLINRHRTYKLKS